MNIIDIVQRSDTKLGRIFDWVVIGLIVISIVTLSIETLPNLSPTVRTMLEVSEIIIVGLFTFEYILRLITTKRKFRYVFSFYGIVDLMAVIPFYISMGTVDMYALRIFRLFRVLRIMKLTRYSRAMERFGKAIVLAKEEIVLFSAVTGILLYLSAVGIYYFEHEAQPEAFPSILHSLWWSVATLTTVGYGDVYPVTTGGKAFTFIVLMCGLGIVAVPAGLLASTLSKVRHDEDKTESR